MDKCEAEVRNLYKPCMKKNTVDLHWKTNHSIARICTSVNSNSCTCNATCMMKHHFFQFSRIAVTTILSILYGLYDIVYIIWTMALKESDIGILKSDLQWIPTIHSKHIKKIINKVSKRYLNYNQRKSIINIKHIFTKFWSQEKC